MTLKRFDFKPGINRETTSYGAEGGWYDCDKVRFRRGLPETLGGWAPISTNTYLGVCRLLWGWATLVGNKLVGVGTNLKFYVQRGGAYYDITPVRATATLTDPFDTTIGLTTVTVTDAAHGCVNNDFVTFSGATAVGGLTLNNEYQVTVIDVDTYTIEADSPASGTANGGGTVTANYQLNTGNSFGTPITGWGGGPFGSGPWGEGDPTTFPLRLWSASNFGEDLIFAYRGGPICIWDASAGLTTRGTLLTASVGASDVPTEALITLVSAVNRFVFAFGCNDIGSATPDPMLIRWSDQEDAVNWTPDATNQAGSIRLSAGSEIIAAIQSRQEVLVWTDSAVYGLQYLGAPEVWGVQILGDNISIASPLAMAVAGSAVYWMGSDKFYRYDGTVTTLPCDVRRYVFSDLDKTQYGQVTCGTNEGFNEVWWFYCSIGSTETDRYVVYNYVDNLWYIGTMGRTAWLDSGLFSYPIGATYSHNLVYHENGVDDNETGTATAMDAHIESSQFDLDDGQHFAFCWRLLPDLTFAGSTANNPVVTLGLTPMQNSGSGSTSPASVGGAATATSTLTLDVPMEEYTGQLDLRIRGRQLVMRVSSDMVGAAWQLGAVRLDLRPDGRR